MIRDFSPSKNRSRQWITVALMLGWIGWVVPALAQEPASNQPESTEKKAEPTPEPRRKASENEKPTRVRLPELGYSDTPKLPDSPWKMHDLYRPHPKSVEGAAYGAPSSDATVLFDGEKLDAWAHRGANPAELIAPRWTLRDGYIEIEPETGDLISLESFGSCQLHLEWMVPEDNAESGPARGDSGVLFMGQFEVQIHDSKQHRTFADGQAGSLYGAHPPLVNASRASGQWQSYDIVFEAPEFEGDQLKRKARATVIHNGLVVQLQSEFNGPTQHRELSNYSLIPPAGPLVLQNHNSRVRFRNIWIRPFER